MRSSRPEEGSQEDDDGVESGSRLLIPSQTSVSKLSKKKQVREPSATNSWNEEETNDSHFSKISEDDDASSINLSSYARRPLTVSRQLNTQLGHGGLSLSLVKTKHLSYFFIILLSASTIVQTVRLNAISTNVNNQLEDGRKNLRVSTSQYGGFGNSSSSELMINANGTSNENTMFNENAMFGSANVPNTGNSMGYSGSDSGYSGSSSSNSGYATNTASMSSNSMNGMMSPTEGQQSTSSYGNMNSASGMMSADQQQQNMQQSQMMYGTSTLTDGTQSNGESSKYGMPNSMQQMNSGMSNSGVPPMDQQQSSTSFQQPAYATSNSYGGSTSTTATGGFSTNMGMDTTSTANGSNTPQGSSYGTTPSYSTSNMMGSPTDPANIAVGSQENTMGTYGSTSSGMIQQPSQTGSYAQQSQTGSYAQQPQTGSYAQQPQTGSYAQQPQTGSYAQQPQTGNYVQQSQSGSYALPASGSDQPSGYVDSNGQVVDDSQNETPSFELIELSNFKDTWDPRELTDLPVFFRIPHTGADVIEKAMRSCHRFIVASENGVADGHGNDMQLNIVNLNVEGDTTPGRFVNIDTTTSSGIQRAGQLGFANSNLADVVITPFIYEANDLLKDNPSLMGRFFAAFRHPIERASIAYEAAKASDPEVAGMTLEEYAGSPKVENNYLTRRLSQQLSGDLDEEHVKLALEVIRRKFLVGLGGNPTATIFRFERFFTWIYRVNPVQQEKCRQEIFESAAANVLVEQGNTPAEGTPAYDLLAFQNQFDLQLFGYIESLWKEQEQFVEGIDEDIRTTEGTCCECDPPTLPPEGFLCPVASTQ